MAEEKKAGNVNLRCRMYRSRYPKVDDVVIIRVKSITEMGAYVTLLEYDNIEGMILLSELSRRRIRSVSKLIRVNRLEVVTVLRVDTEKGYIDLSKRRIQQEDISKMEDKWNKSKAAHSIVCHVSKKCGIDVEVLYKMFVWDLYDKYNHAYDAFRLMVTEPESVLAEFKLEEKLKNTLIKIVQRRLTPQAVRIRAGIEVSCFKYRGIEAIKEALTCAAEMGTKEHPISVKLVAPPLYVLTTTSLEKEEGIKLLQAACDKVEETIKANEGKYKLTQKPRPINDKDDSVLQTLMEKLERENAEVDGDDDSE